MKSLPEQIKISRPPSTSLTAIPFGGSARKGSQHGLKAAAERLDDSEWI